MTRAGRRIRVAAALSVLSSALAACAGSAGTAGTGYVSADHTIVLVPTIARTAPVQLSGRTLQGTGLDIASLRGKVVVLNIWGSWCGPCRKEAPDFEQASRTLAASGVAFVGINVHDDPVPAQRFEQDLRITYPSLVDEGGALLLNLRGAVSPDGIPTTLVLDPAGRVAARISGGTTRTTLVDVVDDVIAGRSTL